MAHRSRMLVASLCVTLLVAGLGAPSALAATQITIDQGQTVSVRIPGVDRATPVRIAWGDGSTTKVRTRCRPATARAHPQACVARAGHAYATAGTFTVAATTRTGRTTTLRTVTVRPVDPSGEPAPPPAGWEQQMLDQVNQLRAAAGVAPLRLCSPLTSAAQSYATRMAKQGFFDHVAPDGATPSDRVEAAGYDWSAVGENIAAGQSSVSRVMSDWRKSAGHYANMISAAFTDVGFGRASSAGNSDSPLWVQDFGAGGTC